MEEVQEKDAVQDFDKPRGQPKGELLSKLVEAINDCGISFNVWFKRNSDGSSSKVLEYTSLVGTQKKNLFGQLPNKFHEFLYPDTCKSVARIWSSFKEYYNMMSDFTVTEHAANDIFKKGKEFVEQFCSLANIRPG